MRTHRLTLALAASIAAASLTLSGCGGSGADTAATGTASATTSTLGFSSPVMSQPTQKFIIDGTKAAGATFGLGVQSYDANLSIDTQVSNIQTMIDRKVNVITAWALDDDAIAGAYAKAAAAGIPVIGINSAGQGVTGTVWWESQTCKSGGVVDKIAQIYATAKPGGKIAVVSGPEAPSIVSLTACFVAAAKNAGLTIVSEQKNTSDSTSGGNAIVTDLLSKYPDLDGIWSYNDSTALGASSAVIAAGKSVYSKDHPDGVVITGGNADDAAITAIKNGTLTATTDPDPICTGYVLAAAVKDVEEHKKLTRDYTVKTSIIDSDTVGDYVAPAEKKCSLDDLPLVSQ